MTELETTSHEQVTPPTVAAAQPDGTPIACPYCGMAGHVTWHFCPRCGAGLTAGAVAHRNFPPQPPAGYHMGPRPAPYDMEKQLKGILPVNTSPLAIIAGYLGIMSILILPAPFAIICGVVALVDLHRKPGRYGHVRAWVGIVMGVLGILIPIIAIKSV